MADMYPEWSPYNYCMQNPVNFVDPDGRNPKSPDDHWVTDKNENAILVDTKGDRVYLNGVEIRKYKFDSQQDYKILSTITTYYFNKNKNAPKLHNGKNICFGLHWKGKKINRII